MTTPAAADRVGGRLRRVSGGGAAAAAGGYRYGCDSCAVLGAFGGGGGGGGTVLAEGTLELDAEVGGAPSSGALTGVLEMKTTCMIEEKMRRKGPT